LSNEDRLVPIAEFADPHQADVAWARLEENGIPASVVTDRAVLGSAEATRLYVEASNVDEAQRAIQDLLP